MSCQVAGTYLSFHGRYELEIIPFRIGQGSDQKVLVVAHMIGLGYHFRAQPFHSLELAFDVAGFEIKHDSFRILGLALNFAVRTDDQSASPDFKSAIFSFLPFRLAG